MPFRIRMRGGEPELEVDTVAELLQVPVRFAGASPLLLASGPAPAPAVAAPGARRGGARGRRSAARRPVVRRVPRAAGVLAELTDEDLLAILKQGPVATGAIAKRLRAPRHRVTARLNDLQARGLAHATGQTASRRWHFGRSL